MSYTHLLSDDSCSIFIEPFAPTHIRPRPPSRFEEEPLALVLHDIYHVKAFHNDGWWSGIVLAVSGPDVTVVFPITHMWVSVDGKEDGVLVMKVPDLLKPQYKWNGKNWRIVAKVMVKSTSK
ncbi:hypothetical protein ABZP36_035206, partial [Zizania latifolia]